MITPLMLPKLTSTLQCFLQDLKTIEPLLDVLSNVVFFIKDKHARYVFVNKTLAQRCGVKNKKQMLDKTSEEIFLTGWGTAYTAQDLNVIQKGKRLSEQLELHLYSKGQSGWCLTYKEPLYDCLGEVVGVVGISQDLNAAEKTHPAFYKVIQVENYIKNNFAESISLSDLTTISGVSISQLERYCKRIYQLTPRQMISKVRLQAAIELLAYDFLITEIGLRCGYTDHSAFCRKFKIHTGMSPSQYRQNIYKK